MQIDFFFSARKSLGTREQSLSGVSLSVFAKPASMLAAALIIAACSPSEDTTESASLTTSRGLTSPNAASQIVSNVADSASVAPSEYQVYFGQTHAHSAWSIDSFGLGNQLSPELGFRFARGEAVENINGTTVQLVQPLDFFMMTDHAEMMGTAPMMLEQGSPVYDTDLAQMVREGKATQAFTAIGNAISSGEALPGFGDPEVQRNVWQQVVAMANEYNEPGIFTTFAAYEWTSLPGEANMHRNVVFRDDIVPDLPFSALDSDRPEDLWAAMESWRENGSTVMAISHNGNSSIGKMFSPLDSDGNFISLEYAEQRLANEPLHEAGQLKGVSMAHPQFSPNDEWADFELWNYHLPSGAPLPPLRANYVREGWKMGLSLENIVGVNPFKFGLVGGSDTHSTINTFEEFNNQGSHALMDNTAEKRMNGMPGQRLGVRGGNLFLSPGTLTGVWAESNERGPIFDAMFRKESYSTSGTRIGVRFFAGYDYPKNMLEQEDWVNLAYRNGVPMGADLPANSDQAPTFIVTAAKSPHSANLDRIQIIKLWTDGVIDYEKIFDVALSDGRKVDPKTGKAPPVGNTVDIATATYTDSIGAPALAAQWQDPDFDPTQNAVYYARVLEIPTPRWSTYDAVALGQPPSDLVPPTIQERAWTSPIWLLAAE